MDMGAHKVLLLQPKPEMEVGSEDADKQMGHSRVWRCRLEGPS